MMQQPIVVANLIQKLQTENEQLHREKDEIETEIDEKIEILEKKCQDEKNWKEIAENKFNKADENLRKEKNEKIEIKVKLQNEIELEKKLQEKENERIEIELKFKYESEAKNELIVQVKDTEQSLQQEIERRRNVEDENRRIKKENEKQKKENERLKQELKDESYLVKDFEQKYVSEFEEKEKEQIIANEELQKRKEVEKQLRDEQNQKRKALEMIESKTQTISELEETNLNDQKDKQIKTEEYEKEKEKNEKIEKQIKKAKNDEEIRKQTEIEKQKVEQKNSQLSKENEKMKYEVIQMKMKYGEQQTDQLIKDLENKEREKDEEIQKLKEDLQKERLKNEKEKKKAEKEKLKLEPPQELQINIINPDPVDFSSSVEANGQLKISKKQNKWNTFSLSQVLENGVYATEVEFFNTKGGHSAVGIVKDTYTIATDGIMPGSSPHDQNMAAYVGARYNGQVYYKGTTTAGNTRFVDNQIVKMEYDSEKGTIIFFVAGIQQPVCISGIKEKIRFITTIHHADAYCIIRSLKKLSAPTSGHVANEQTVQW
ncbi:MAG: hypothetical protein EZS28_004384 [Streblomastix strix]|uniref:B30.2/SPRY domain-containing protein n=1 Tax=Streblomastix strix TaxID=222440 RepID=A0A5J4WYZ6_9EUKA|nr:MAG: hypothetical protein EZS28_004384 [Streblomastix strix]